ncbi:hypothetical protein AB0L59_08115 [Streptomyces sp. NPDC052109]|uniref:hypothetical protein n=1 Tax=Streptomyces sp. NPDC052109 TaxID=3155527 RepID=UPI00344890D6
MTVAPWSAAVDRGEVATKDPACARIAVRCPDRLDGDRRDRVSYAGPAAWGHGRCACGPLRPGTRASP